MTQLETWKDLIDRKRFTFIRMADKGKKPIERGWQNLGYRTLEDIGFRPGENAGIITGETSGVLVLDIDNPRLFGEFSKREALNVPETFTVRTAKGTHHYYQYPQDGCRYGNKAYGNHYGFDIRGDGGCIVAPGSVHPDGTVYVIELNTEIAEAPKWVVDMARETKSPIEKSSPNQKERCTKATNRSQMDTLDSLSLPPTLEQTILAGAPIGKRSETIWFVLNGLKELGVSNETILDIFEQYPIGEKYLEKGELREQWLLQQIEKVEGESEARIRVQGQTIKIPTEENLSLELRQLVNHASQKLINRLQEFGNEPSEKHRKALRDLLCTYAGMASGETKGRIAFPLATGLGKTTSIVCFLAAAYELGKLKDISPVVATSKVEQLCDLKRQLLDMGIPEADISLIHSYQYDSSLVEGESTGETCLPTGFASLPATEDTNRPILLVTHNKIMSNSDCSKFMRYLRKLIIWDESLISTEVSVVNLRFLEMELASYGIDCKHLEHKRHDATLFAAMKRTSKYLQECFLLVEQEVNRQRDGNPKQKIVFPVADNRKEMKIALGKSRDHLKAFFDLTENELVVHVKSLQDPSILHYAVVVPDHLANIVILDASASVRSLVTLDSSIFLPENLDVNVVSYDGTVFARIDHNAGRDSLVEEFRSGDNGLLPAIVEIIQQRPGEPFLLFTFKHREQDRLDCRQVIEKGLRNVGIDPQETISVDGKAGKGCEVVPRFNWLTHGNETASNSYSFCQNVIFVGLIHLPREVLTGKILAQQRDTLANLMDETFSDIEKAEQAYVLHQGSCRSAMRTVKDDKALPVNVWFTYRNDCLQNKLKETLPGVRWVVHESEYLKAKTAVETLRRAIVKYLGSFVGSKVSSQKIRKAIEGVECHRSVFTEATRLVSDDASVPWTLQAKSLVRM